MWIILITGIDHIVHLVHFISIPANHLFPILFFGILQKSKGDVITVLKVEKEDLESLLYKEKLQTLQLKQELSEAETRNSDLCKVTTLIVEAPFLFLKQMKWAIMFFFGDQGAIMLLVHIEYNAWVKY